MAKKKHKRRFPRFNLRRQAPKQANKQIEEAVRKVVEEYGEVLRKLGKQ